MKSGNHQSAKRFEYHLRHLNSSQKAFVALKVEELFAKSAEKRMKAGKADPVERIPQGSGKASEQAGAAVGVNRHYVTDAKKIRQQAPELEKRIMSGELTLPQAKRELSARLHRLCLRTKRCA